MNPEVLAVLFGLVETGSWVLAALALLYGGLAVVGLVPFQTVFPVMVMVSLSFLGKPLLRQVVTPGEFPLATSPPPALAVASQPFPLWVGAAVLSAVFLSVAAFLAIGRYHAHLSDAKAQKKVVRRAFATHHGRLSASALARLHTPWDIAAAQAALEQWFLETPGAALEVETSSTGAFVVYIAPYAALEPPQAAAPACTAAPPAPTELP